MDRRVLLICYGCILLHFLTSSGVCAYTAVEVTLKRYVVDGNHFDGSKCDELLGPLGLCDPEFIFCFDVLNGSNDMNNCTFHRIQTSQWDNTNTIQFEDKFIGASYSWDDPTQYYEMSNPISVHGFHNSFQGFRLKVAVYDNDIDGDDLIDLMYFNFTEDPARNYSVAVRQEHILHGTRISSPSNLTIEILVYCGTNSYKNDCSVYCYQYSSSNFICHPDTGEKICSPGYESPQDDCSVKIDDCEINACVNGGTCLDGYKSYTCACLRNYTGPFCQYHKCDLNYHFCKNGGTCYTDDYGDIMCFCRNGFHGETCNARYEEQQESDSKGGFPVWAIAIIIFVIIVIIAAIVIVYVLKKRKANPPTNNTNGVNVSNPTFSENNTHENGAVANFPPAYTETAQPLPRKQPPPADTQP